MFFRFLVMFHCVFDFSKYFLFFFYFSEFSEVFCIRGVFSPLVAKLW
jgi:hypothetical protein